jgi:hypothetical protein
VLLRVTAGRLHTAAAADLAQVPMSRLKRLLLDGTQVSPTGIGYLMDAVWMAGAEELDLAGTWMGHEVALVVAGSPRVGSCAGW